VNETLIHACEMFLIPATILFVALALAPTDKLKQLIAILGVLTSLIWLFRILFWKGVLTSVDFTVTFILALIFLAAWLIALYGHTSAWRLTERP
jgi:hypothetical protein